MKLYPLIQLNVLLDQLRKACQRPILANTIARLHELVIDDISVQASSKRQLFCPLLSLLHLLVQVSPFLLVC